MPFYIAPDTDFLCDAEIELYEECYSAFLEATEELDSRTIHQFLSGEGPDIQTLLSDALIQMDVWAEDEEFDVLEDFIFTRLAHMKEHLLFLEMEAPDALQREDTDTLIDALCRTLAADLAQAAVPDVAYYPIDPDFLIVPDRDELAGELEDTGQVNPDGEEGDHAVQRLKKQQPQPYLEIEQQLYAVLDNLDLESFPVLMRQGADGKLFQDLSAQLPDVPYEYTKILMQRLEKLVEEMRREMTDFFNPETSESRAASDGKVSFHPIHFNQAATGLDMCKASLVDNLITLIKPLYPQIYPSGTRHLRP